MQMNECMKAVAITGERRVEILSMRIPRPKPNEVLINIRACALCTWEQRVFKGEKKTPLPLIGGHEIAGQIVALGEDVDPQQFPVGAAVAPRIIKACQSCSFCRRGNPTQCIQLNTFHLNGPDVYGMGGFAEYICLESSAVWCFNRSLPFEEMALTEPLACVLHSIYQAKPLFGDDAVVIGGGIMGQLHLMCLNKKGVRTILSEPDYKRRDFALSRGCKYLIDPSSEDAVEAVKKKTGGRGAQAVFNTTAIASVGEEGMRMLENTGRYVAFSSIHPDLPISLNPNWLHSSEVVLTGAVNPSIQSFEQAVNLLDKGWLDLKDLITDTYPVDKAQQAFERAIAGDAYRVVITF